MATNELRGVAEAHGLEPHIGFLHQIDYATRNAADGGVRRTFRKRRSDPAALPR